jgi:hypothetical protein
MSALSTYLESGLLKHIFLGVAMPAEFATTYVGLVKNFDSGKLEGSDFTDEPSIGDSYERVAVVSSTSSWSSPYISGTAMAINNVSGFQFKEAKVDIGYVSGVFIANASTGGKVLLYGRLTNGRTINEGNQFVFSSGALKITFN